MTSSPFPSERRLAPGVHAAFVDDDMVFLDIPRDSYVCLPAAAAFLQISADGASLRGEPNITAELEQAGLVCCGPGDLPRPTAPWRPATRSALRDSYPSPVWHDSVEICRSLVDLAARYRGRSFAAILTCGRSKRAQLPSLSADLLAAVDRFHRWSPYAPTSTKCLVRSFMLLRFLHRQGFDAEWVFGVRTWPFSAHCWLQCEDVALDEQSDRIRSFTPILVV